MVGAEELVSDTKRGLVVNLGALPVVLARRASLRRLRARAGALGIVDGAEVSLSNQAGSLTFTARIADDIPPGTLLTHKSRWPKMRGDGVNVNLLHIPQKTDMGESTSVHATEVQIEKVA